MSDPTSNSIMKADAITYALNNPDVIHRALRFLLDFLKQDTRSPNTADTYGYAVSFKIAEHLGIDRGEAIKVCDYLWLCRLVDRAVLMGNYMYRILSAGEYLLTYGNPIKFDFDPEIFPKYAYGEVLAYQAGNREVFDMLYEGGVEWGSEEYWKRYWKWQSEKRTAESEQLTEGAGI